MIKINSIFNYSSKIIKSNSEAQILNGMNHNSWFPPTATLLYRKLVVSGWSSVTTVQAAQAERWWDLYKRKGSLLKGTSTDSSLENDSFANFCILTLMQRKLKLNAIGHRVPFFLQGRDIRSRTIAHSKL